MFGERSMLLRCGAANPEAAGKSEDEPSRLEKIMVLLFSLAVAGALILLTPVALLHIR